LNLASNSANSSPDPLKEETFPAKIWGDYYNNYYYQNQKNDMDGGGVPIRPKTDEVIFEQPLMVYHISISISGLTNKAIKHQPVNRLKISTFLTKGWKMSRFSDTL
jgi:hypothetical protein